MWLKPGLFGSWMCVCVGRTPRASCQIDPIWCSSVSGPRELNNLNPGASPYLVSQKTNRKPRPPKSLEETRIPKDKSQAPSPLRFWQKRVSQKSNRKPRLPQEFGRNSYPKRKIASPVPLRVWKKFVSQKTNRKPRPP